MASTKKVKRYVIDVNSLITIFINREIDWLVHFVAKNNVELFVDTTLINELRRVLEYPKIKKLLPFDSIFYVNLVYAISTSIIAKPFHIKSPDPEDNYLYDIALSAHAKLLVTGEKALLLWIDSPVETISLSTFKKLF